MMRKACLTPVLAMLLLTLCGTSHAQVYKWVDAQGKIHYSDTPPPPGQAKNIESKKTNGNVVETDTEPFATKLAAQKYPVSLYTFPGCGQPCEKGQELLEKRGIPYTAKSTEEDRAALKQLTGDTQIPVLVVGNKTPRRGFEASTWNSMLDEAGYPKSNPLANIRKPTTPAATPAATTEPETP